MIALIIIGLLIIIFSFTIHGCRAALRQEWGQL